MRRWCPATACTRSELRDIQGFGLRVCVEVGALNPNWVGVMTTVVHSHSLHKQESEQQSRLRA